MKISYKAKSIALLLVMVISHWLSSCTKENDLERKQKEEAITDLIGLVRPDSLASYVSWLEEMGTRFALSEGRRDVALKIRDKFREFGYPETELDSFYLTRTYKEVTYRQWQYNVVARLAGARYPDSVCVVGAHYDNILSTGDPFGTVYGANDNASGVAAALELARIFNAGDYSPDCTFEFVAFAAEELGLHGSASFAQKALQEGKIVKFMLNNDMIAYQPSQDPGSWYVNIMDYENSGDLRQVAQSMCKKFTLLKTYNDNTMNNRSDSYPFALSGFPALFFYNGASDPNYHTLNDRTDNCNFTYSGEIVKISAALLVWKD